MDGTKTGQDTSQTEDTSGKTRGTSEKEPETFTKEQMADIVKKAESDALSKAGRTATTLDKRETTGKLAEERMAQERKDRDLAEQEDARDDKETLSAVLERQKHRDTKSKLATAEAERDTLSEEVKATKTQTQEFERTQKAAEIAVKYGVDFNTLVKFATTPEAMEELAQTLKKGEVKEPIISDSGKTAGGDTMPDSAKGKIKAGWEERYK